MADRIGIKFILLVSNTINLIGWVIVYFGICKISFALVLVGMGVQGIVSTVIY